MTENSPDSRAQSAEVEQNLEDRRVHSGARDHDSPPGADRAALGEGLDAVVARLGINQYGTHLPSDDDDREFLEETARATAENSDQIQKIHARLDEIQAQPPAKPRSTPSDVYGKPCHTLGCDWSVE